jgi:hypothetical protein
VWATLALPAGAEMRNEEHLVGDWMVKIAILDTIEITIGSRAEAGPDGSGCRDPGFPVYPRGFFASA